jgi:hypothetical protein
MRLMLSAMPDASPAVPQLQTYPSSRITCERVCPAVIARAPVSVRTCTGMRDSVCVLSPSWPSPLSPHVHTVPSFASAIA